MDTMSSALHINRESKDLPQTDRYRFLVEHSPDILFSCTLTGHFLFVNATMRKLIGLKDSELIGYAISSFMHSDINTLIWQSAFERLRHNQRPETFEIEWHFADGKDHLLSITLSPHCIENGQIQEVFGTAHDITNLRLTETGCAARYDALTGLPNRLLLIERLNTALHHAQRTQTQLAVLFLDFDNFKKINDTLGHMAGDEFILTISRELSKVLRKEETLARLSGDEFVIVLQNVTCENNVACFIDRVKSVFTKSYHAGRNMIHVSCSIGVALYPSHGSHCEELLKNADTAMYKAKELGKNNVQIYSNQMRNKEFNRLMLEGHLGNALINNEFSLHYQPQIDASTGRIRGFEALLRWHNPALGDISPCDFISLAEETGFIIPIGEWVLKTACAANQAWNTRYGTEYVVSVNVSSLQLKLPNFNETVKTVLAETGLDPTLLEIEITESILIESFDAIVQSLRELNKLGVRISLDDFGTGYSSINYLKKLPLTTLKLDKSLIDNVKTDRAEEEIVKTLITLLHKFNIRIIAEGVETKEQLSFLMNTRCDYLQGFLLCRPQSAENLLPFLTKQQINLAELLEFNYVGQFI